MDKTFSSYKGVEALLNYYSIDCGRKQLSLVLIYKPVQSLVREGTNRRHRGKQQAEGARSTSRCLYSQPPDEAGAEVVVA